MVKQATKGQKEIYTENWKTIPQYGIACLITGVIYTAGCNVGWQCSSSDWIFFVVTALIQGGAILFMMGMAKARKDENGRVVDAGMDLNDPAAFGEYCKDAIILTVITQLVALFSTYGYLLLLAFPGSILYKFVFSFLLPWVFAPSEGEVEPDEKKMRKRERRQEKVVFRSR